MDELQAGRSAFGFRFVVPLALGAMLNPVNSTMISPALVSIQRDLRATGEDIGWLISSLYVASAVAQPLMGRFADIFGARRVYLAALSLVALSGTIGHLASSFGWLVGGRVILGIGTSAAYPAAMRMFRQRALAIGAPPPRAAMGILSLAALSSMALGPLLGGMLTHWFGWHSIFTANIPLALLTAILVSRWIPRSRREPAPLQQVIQELDPLGAVFFTLTLLAFLFLLLSPSLNGWWAFPVTLGVACALLYHSLKHPTPFFDVRMLIRNRPLTITYLRAAALSMISYCIIYGFAQWLEVAAGYNSAETGALMLPMTIVAASSAYLGARTPGIRLPFLMSITCALLGSACFLFLDQRSSVWAIVTASMFFGVPQGMFQTSTQAAVYVQAPASAAGAAAGLQRAAQYIGAIAATSMLARFYRNGADDAGFHNTALVMGCLSAVLLVATSLDRTIPRGRIG